MNKYFNSEIVQVDGVRAITGGGTGANNAAQARTNLGIAGASTDVQIFTTTGSTNWTKPTGAKSINIQLLGGGGGGGGGRKNITLTNRSGGGGGGGGGYLNVTIPASLLPSTPINITIGVGGAGGAGATVNNNDGLPGLQGGSTIFGTAVSGTITYIALGGVGGNGGTAVLASGGTGSINANNGGQGNIANGAAGLPPQQITAHFMGGAGGGGGGGISNLDAVGTGSNGGRSNVLNLAGGTPSAAGINNTNAVNGLIAVGSGGGGGAGSLTAAGNGGNGGFPSSGGGGGGAAQASNGGNGGTGGAGMAIITTYF
jgi:hypothetical protein